MITEERHKRGVRALWQQKGAAYRAILANASSLVGATAATSMLGFVYWWLAARQYSPQQVGLASAAISAMTLLGTIGMLGLGTLLIGELSRHRGREGAILMTASIVTALAGGALGVAFALLAPVVSGDFLPLRESVTTVALFAVGVALTAMTLMLDQALIGMMRGGLQLARNILFAAVKLVALVAVTLWTAHAFGLTIYATWTLGNVLSLGLLVAFGVTRGAPLRRFVPDWRLLRALRGAALGHHGLNLALQFSNLMLPLVVTVTLSSSANAFFYTAWMVAGFVFTVPYALTIVLYAVGKDDPIALARKIRFTLRVAFLTGVAANVVLWLVAPFVLRLFGATYAALSSGPLRVLAFGVFALIVKDHYVAVSRIEQRILAAAARIFAGSCFELAGAAVGAVLGGLVGLTIGWLIAVTIEAMLMASAVARIAAPFGVRHWQLPVEADAVDGPEPAPALTVAQPSGSVPSAPSGHR